MAETSKPGFRSGGRQDGLTSVERDELARLRGEVKQLRKANEILKAASVFFVGVVDTFKTEFVADRPWRSRSASL